ncbi:glycosyltransferase [Limosilactobacillus fermentum]|uniref:glycosyltransferase n=2 Tax=Lactobacillaceae TaxID=33958 RepID=UPI003DA50BB0
MLAEINNPEDLRKKVENVLVNNKLESYEKNARRRQEQNFSIQAFISNFEKMYTKVITS